MISAAPQSGYTASPDLSRYRTGVLRRHGHNCYYCGVALQRKDRITLDHFEPRLHGGRETYQNLVPACSTCNCIKGSKTVEQAREALMQRRLGWPQFTSEQREWLRENGFDLSPLSAPNGLYFERVQVMPMNMG